MPSIISAKETSRIGIGMKAQAAIKLAWPASNHLGHLSCAEAAHNPASRAASARSCGCECGYICMWVDI